MGNIKTISRNEIMRNIKSTIAPRGSLKNTVESTQELQLDSEYKGALNQVINCEYSSSSQESPTR